MACQSEVTSLASGKDEDRPLKADYNGPQVRGFTCKRCSPRAGVADDSYEVFIRKELPDDHPTIPALFHRQ
jgi:hypothetical protein